MASISTALAAVLAIVIIAAVVWLAKKTQVLRAAAAGWGKQIDPECDRAPGGDGDPCSDLLSGPLPAPPRGSESVSLADAVYASRFVSRFIAFANSGEESLTSIVGMRAPALVFSSRDPTLPMAAVWAAADGKSAAVAIRGTKTLADFRLDVQYSQTQRRARQVATGRRVPVSLVRKRRAAAPPPSGVEATPPPGVKLDTVQSLPEMVPEMAPEMAPEMVPEMVHGGMYSAYADIRGPLFAALPAGATAAGGAVFIAGHSMGAAIAFYLAADLAARHPAAAVTAVGVAPPRAGNAAFAAGVGAAVRAASVINLSDLVPSVPWAYMPSTVPPYAPDEFAHVVPIFLFDRQKADIAACHGTLAYFEGLTAADPPAIVPSS